MTLLVALAVVLSCCLRVNVASCLPVISIDENKERSVAICISQISGEIQSVSGQVNGRQVKHEVVGATQPDGCYAEESGVHVQQTPQGGVSVDRTMRCQSNYWHHENKLIIRVKDVFTPSPSTVSVTWQVTVESTEMKFWTTAIDTSIVWNNYSNSLFWTGGPLNEMPLNESYNPLDPIKLPTKSSNYFRYGGGKTDIRDPQVVVSPSMAIPVATRINPQDDTGVSILFSPEDSPVYSLLNSYSFGSNFEMAVFNYSRQYHRLGNMSTAVVFTQDIIIHEGCWRAPLAWMTEKYIEYFRPDQRVDTYSLDGAGAYADYNGFQLDSDKFDNMDFTVNWDATFPYPYHGMWLPYSPFYSSPWLTCFPHHLQNGTSQPCINLTYSNVDSYYQTLRSAGFHSLAYANLFEYDFNIVELNATLDCPPNATNQTKITCDSNHFLRQNFSSAILRDRKTNKMIYGGDGVSIIMDPGTDVYQTHILNMAKTIITKTSCEGIAIDRQDWIGYVNPHRDDGRTWFATPDTDGSVSQAMIFSWKETMSVLAALMHKAGRAIFINDHTYRLDMMQNVDGFYDEFGDNNAKMMATSLLSIGGKPAIAWNHDTTTDLDEFLQRHLFWGVYPTVPFPTNDHSINPSSSVDVFFEDYGPLFAALRGKRWVLDVHAVALTNNSAQANVYQTKNSFVVAVVFGQESESEVEILLKIKEIQAKPKRLAALYPGSRDQHELGRATYSNGALTIIVKLSRGCALLLIEPI